jgi:hypothetical protein
MMKSIKIPEWLKITLFIGIIYLVYVLGQKFFIMFKNALAGIGIGTSTQTDDASNASADAANSQIHNTLPQAQSVYLAIADDQWNQMKGVAFPSYDNLANPLSSLSSDEMKAVKAAFAVRPDTIFGISTHEGDLFDYYRVNMKGWALWGDSDITKMRALWAKTGLNF